MAIDPLDDALAALRRRQDTAPAGADPLDDALAALRRGGGPAPALPTARAEPPASRVRQLRESVAVRPAPARPVVGPRRAQPAGDVVLRPGYNLTGVTLPEAPGAAAATRSLMARVARGPAPARQPIPRATEQQQREQWDEGYRREQMARAGEGEVGPDTRSQPERERAGREGEAFEHRRADIRGMSNGERALFYGGKGIVDAIPGSGHLQQGLLGEEVHRGEQMADWEEMDERELATYLPAHLASAAVSIGASNKALASAGLEAFAPGGATTRARVLMRNAAEGIPLSFTQPHETWGDLGMDLGLNVAGGAVFGAVERVHPRLGRPEIVHAMHMEPGRVPELGEQVIDLPTLRERRLGVGNTLVPGTEEVPAYLPRPGVDQAPVYDEGPGVIQRLASGNPNPRGARRGVGVDRLRTDEAPGDVRALRGSALFGGPEVPPSPAPAPTTRSGATAAGYAERAAARVAGRGAPPAAGTVPEATTPALDAARGIAQRGERPTVARLMQQGHSEADARAAVIAVREEREAGVPAGARPPREPIKGSLGRQTTVDFPDGGQVQARYRLVEADDVLPSHHPVSFQRSADYPEGVQGREYHLDTDAQERVAEHTTAFDPERVLDPTRLVSTGPPVINARGIAVAGNERSMLLRRVREMNPQAHGAYRRALAERASYFGLDPKDVESMRSPVLVREVTDAGLDMDNPQVLRELNTRSDQAVGKAKDALSDAATRSRAMRGGRAVQHMADTLEPDGTLRGYLTSPDGRRFVDQLVEDGVIPPAERPRFMNPKTGTLNAAGLELVENSLLLSAIPDVDAVAAMPDGARAALQHSTPHIVVASRVPGWDIGGDIAEALRLHIEARSKGLTVDSLLGNTEMFGRAEMGPHTEALARLLERGKQREVTQFFRDYARMARAAERMAQSEDLFGELPPQQAETIRRLMGSAEGREAMMAALAVPAGAGAQDQERSPAQRAALAVVALGGAGLASPAVRRAVLQAAKRAWEESAGLRTALADRIAPEAAQERRTMQRELDTDVLTGLGSRRALDRALPTAEAEPGTRVIVFDANNFGQVNKILGQEAGDRMIRDVGDAVRAAAAEVGMEGRVFRRGGDEFVVLAPADAAEQLRTRAEELFTPQRINAATEVSLSGTVGDTFEEADGLLQARKKERKAAPTPPKRIGRDAFGDLPPGGSAGDNVGSFLRGPKEGDTPSARLIREAEEKGQAVIGAQHNTTAENLLKADRLGGMPAPSIAIVKEGAGVEGYGEISLIGRRPLFDPAETPIYDADIYSTSHVRPVYRGAQRAKVDRLHAEFAPFFAETAWDDSRLRYDLHERLTGRDNDPHRLLRDLEYSRAGKAAFLAEQGIKIEPPRRAMYEGRLEGHPAVQEWATTIGKDWDGASEPAGLREVLLKAVQGGVRPPNNPKMVMKEVLAAIDSQFFPDGRFALSRIDSLIRNAREAARKGTELDHGEADRLLNAAMKGREHEYRRWLEGKILPLMGDPMLREGRKLVPYNLDSVTRAMTAGRSIHAQEKGMTHGEGYTRAKLARRIGSLDEAKNMAPGSIADEAEVSAARDRAKELMEDYRTQALEHYTHTDWRGQVDTWRGLDDAMEALTKAGRFPTKSTMRTALSRAGFRGVPDSVVELALEARRAMMDAPVPYFEGKPQRAVGIEEFAGAVVPKDVDPEALAVLERRGVPVRTYESSDQRGELVRTFRRELHDAGQNTLGAAHPRAMTTLAGAGVGAAVGGSEGDTPGERIRNAALGAAAGAAAGLAGPETIQRLRQMDRVGALGDPSAFYSRLERAIGDFGQDRGTADQWLKHLESRSTRGEREWTGVQQYLDAARKEGRPVSREEIRALYDGNAIRLEETTLGHKPAVSLDEVRAAIQRGEPVHATKVGDPEKVVNITLDDGRTILPYVEAHPSQYVFHVGDVDVAVRRADGSPKYQQYTLPGGENYREVLIRMPQRSEVDALRARHAEEVQAAREAAKGDNEEAWQAAAERVSQAARALRLAEEAESAGAFRTGHWEQPNVLLHLRLNDRTLPTGEKVLFVEELQSDWHQQGRKQGYRTVRAEADDLVAEVFSRVGNDTIWTVSRRDGGTVWSGIAVDEAAARRAAVESTVTPWSLWTGVPDAPFKKTDEWMGLGMKRVLEEAAEGGYDRVAWTTGAQQADRYNLAKQVSRIDYDPKTGRLRAFGTGSDLVLDREGVKWEQLPDLIGKDAADRLHQRGPREWRVVSRAEYDAHHGLQTATGVGREHPWMVVDQDMVKAPSGDYRERAHAEEDAAGRASTPGAGRHVLEGADLEVGGEGMKGFYDRMIPNWLKDYGRRLGVRIDVEPMSTRRHPDQDVEAWWNRIKAPEEPVWSALDAEGGSQDEVRQLYEEARHDDIHDPTPGKAPATGPVVAGNPSFRMTPELRERVLDGQPLLSHGGVGGALVGGAYGSTQGDDEGERMTNAALFAAVGAGVGTAATSRRLAAAGERLARSRTLGTGLGGLQPTFERGPGQIGAVGPRDAAGRTPFYSRLEQAIVRGQRIAPAEQWLKYLDGVPGGIARGERDWTGIDQFLQSRAGTKVTREELAQHMAGHRLDVDESVLGWRPEIEQARTAHLAAQEDSRSAIEEARSIAADAASRSIEQERATMPWAHADPGRSLEVAMFTFEDSVLNRIRLYGMKGEEGQQIETWAGAFPWMRDPKVRAAMERVAAAGEAERAAEVLADPTNAYRRASGALSRARMDTQAALENLFLMGETVRFDDVRKIRGQVTSGPLDVDGIMRQVDSESARHGSPRRSEYLELIRHLLEKENEAKIAADAAEQRVAHSRARYRSYVQPGLPDGTDGHYREVLIRLKRPEPKPGADLHTNQGERFTESHWSDIPDILAHVRLTDRTTPDGQRVLFVEEVQSDWHQKGREYGYATREKVAAREAASAEADDIRRQLIELNHKHNYNPPFVEVKPLEDRLAELDAVTRHQVPGLADAPFKQTDEWMGLALKRVIDEAVEGGYDRVAWVTGDQSKRVVGGQVEGQREFYDRMVPRWIRKYAQKMGVEIEGVDIPGLEAGGRAKEWVGPELTDARLREAEEEYLRTNMDGQQTRHRVVYSLQAMRQHDPGARVHAMTALATIGPDDPINYRIGQRLLEYLGGEVKDVERAGAVGSNLSFKVPQQLRDAVKTNGQALYTFPGPFLGALKTTAGQTAAAAGLGAALDPEHPLRGAVVLAGATLAIKHGMVAKTVGRLRRALREGRLLEALDGLDDAQVQQLSERVGRWNPSLGEAITKAVAEREARLGLSPVELAQRQVADMRQNVLRPVVEGRALAAKETDALVGVYQISGREIRHAIVDQLEEALDLAPPGRAKQLERLIDTLEAEGYRKVSPSSVNAGEHVNLGTFALDPMGRQRLERQVQEVAASEGLDPKTPVTWDQTREVARTLGVSPLDISPDKRLSGAEMLAIRNQVRENVQGIEALSLRLAQQRSELTAVEVRAIEQTIQAAEEQNRMLLSRFMRSRSQTGRDLNNLKILANQTMDPAIWMARVQDVLEKSGREFTAEHRARIQKIIDSCGA